MTELNDRWLVGKLVEVFERFPSVDDTAVDAAVREAKQQRTQNRFTLEAIQRERQDRRNVLGPIFDHDLQTLSDRGCPQWILEEVSAQRERVLDVASAKERPWAPLPVPLVGPVIPAAYLGYPALMAMVRNGERAGHTRLNPAAVVDQIETPRGLYWLYDVDDGEAGGNLPQADRSLKGPRSPLTVAETIMLCALRDVLSSRRGLWCLGSRFMADRSREFDRMPVIYLDSTGQPVLGERSPYSAPISMRGASCGARLGPFGF